ncbi:MAG: arginine deiminase family protein [Candidatus Methanofastidiosia archaeon]
MYGAQSEYQPLKKVIMHTPGHEVTKVTEANKRDYLYREPVVQDKMKEEHEMFVQFLRDEKVEVILVEVTVCPNLLFTRDIASVSKKGALLMRPAFSARFFEPLYLNPVFEKLSIPVLEVTRGCCEGGDLVYLDEDTLMIGFGPRTDFDGIVQVSQYLLGSAVKEVIAVPLPSFRVHLDGSLMILDKDLAIFHPGSLLFPAYTFTDKTLVMLPELLEERGFTLIEVKDEETSAFGPNIFMVNPRLAVSYSWNTRIISELQEHSIEVFPLPGHELVKAGGGPHCMTLPVLRKK